MGIPRVLTALLGAALVAPFAFTSQEPEAGVHFELRFVDGSGAPVDGVSTAIRARPSATTWAPVISGADGRVALGCAVTEVVVLEATHATRATARWVWVGLEAGQERDLGDVVLPGAAAVNVHIVDAAGELLGQGWRVQASDEGGERGPDRANFHLGSPVDLATGSCKLTGLTPGRVHIGARGPGIATIEAIEITVAAGSTLDVQLVYKGEDLASFITVAIEPHLVPFGGYGPSPVTLVDAHGQRRPLTRSRGVDLWYIAGLADGEYALEIDERPFVPWRVEGVRPGQPVRAVLRGDAEVQLEVVGIDGLTPHKDYRVFARHFGDDTGRLGRALTPSAPGTYGDLPAGTLDLEVEVAGLPMRRVRIVDLEPGEVRVVRTQLTTLGSLRGVLRDARGGAVAGQRVEVTRGEVAGHARGGSAQRRIAGVRRLGPIPRVEHVLSTDERGEFSLDGLAPDLYSVRVPLTVVTMVDRVVEVVPGDGSLVELVLPPLYDARLRVLVPEGVDATKLVVSVARADGLGGRLRAYGEPHTVALDEAGRCTVPRLEEGEYALELVPGFGGEPVRDLGGFALGRYLYLEPGEDPAEVEHVFDARAR